MRSTDETKFEADDTALLRKGHPLVILDDSDVNVLLQKSETPAGNAMHKVCQFNVNVERMKAFVGAVKIELARVENDYHLRTVAQDGPVSVREPHARQTVDATAALDVGERKLAAARALVADTNLEYHPTVFQAKVNVLDTDASLPPQGPSGSFSTPPRPFAITILFFWPRSRLLCLLNQTSPNQTT